jgi:rhamnose transport system substrate-binding protein
MTFAPKRVLALAAVAVTAALALTACADTGSSSPTSGSSGGSGNLSITFLPKNLGNPYFDTSAKGGQAAVAEFGGTFNQVGPAQASPDGQVSYINTATQQGVGALVVSANDHRDLVPRHLRQPGDVRRHRQGAGRPDREADRRLG